MIDIKEFIINFISKYGLTDINVNTGRIDEMTEKTVLIQNIQNKKELKLFNQNFHNQHLSILIHWNEDYTETRQNSIKIYNALKELSNYQFQDNLYIVRTQMDNDMPQDLLNKKTNIYEQEIDFYIYYINA